jgi:acetyl esterase/lipase
MQELVNPDRTEPNRLKKSTINRKIYSPPVTLATSSPLSPLSLPLPPPRLRMLIFVAEEDYLTIAAKNYYEKLKRSGWKGTVELVENEKEDHCFHLLLGIL